MDITQTIEQHWQKPKWWLSVLLYPFSRVFSLVSIIRRWLYQQGILKGVQIRVPVVVIGNIHSGGVGKTPITAALAQDLQNIGIKIGIISRGYGRQTTDVRIVKASDTPQTVGDEPLFLVNKTGVPMAVGIDRVAAAELLLSKYPDIQMILSDDGLQHYRLARDGEIIVFPASDIGESLDVLPNGCLREPLSRLRYADFILISNNACDMKWAYPLPDSVTVLSSTLEFGALYAFRQPEKTVRADFFTNKKTVALAGIARPERFFNTLYALGIKVDETISLPDHKALTIEDIPPDTEALIITEKDAVKLGSEPLPPVWILPLNAIIPPELSMLVKKKFWYG